MLTCLPLWILGEDRHDGVGGFVSQLAYTIWGPRLDYMEKRTNFGFIFKSVPFSTNTSFYNFYHWLIAPNLNS